MKFSGNNPGKKACKFKMAKLFGAVDLSGKAAAFALADETGKLLLDLNRPMRGRESAQLASWMVEELGKINRTIGDVTHWSVGSGPGSFTGMRLAAALATGWSSNLPVSTRCVPTAFAIAAQSGCQGNVAILFDGKNSELLAYEATSENNEFRATGFTAVWNADEAKRELASGRFSAFAALRDDAAAIAKLLGDDALERVKIVEQLSAAPLIQSSLPYDGDLTRLVYIRPAVFPKAE